MQFSLFMTFWKHPEYHFVWGGWWGAYLGIAVAIALVTEALLYPIRRELKKQAAKEAKIIYEKPQQRVL